MLDKPSGDWYEIIAHGLQSTSLPDMLGKLDKRYSISYEDDK